MEEYLKEGTVIYYKTNEYSIVGEIVGTACNEQPIIGITYIIKILSVEGKIYYNYSCITLPRILFKLESKLVNN